MIISSLTSPPYQACNGNMVENFVNITYEGNKVTTSIITISTICLLEFMLRKYCLLGF